MGSEVQSTADVTANYRIATPALLTAQVSRGDPAVTRILVETLETHRLSLFATALASNYRHLGLFPALTALQTKVVSPTEGTTCRGTSLVVAAASDASGIRTVSFVATGVSGGRRYVLGNGRPTLYGWVILWDTKAVPNGRYELTSLATGPGGRTSRSQPVAVAVANGGPSSDNG